MPKGKLTQNWMATHLLVGDKSIIHRTTKRPRTNFAKIPRNAPCPCGSGKKFKMCCKQT